MKRTYEVETNLLGMFNIHNLLAVIATCHLNGMRITNILDCIKTLPQVEGRLQHVRLGQSYRVIVDYAHTPDGFEKVFEYADIITPKDHKIITVFGAAGLRDTKKTRDLGHRGRSLLYQHHPDRGRSQDRRLPWGILEQVATGIKNTRHLIILDRFDAIRQAIELANTNDTVLVLGKGNEDYIYRLNGKEHWIGDVTACEQILNEIKDEKEKPSWLTRTSIILY